MCGDRYFHEAAFDVTRRMRVEWANDEAGVLVERLKFMAKGPHCVFTWGTWRAHGKRTAGKHTSPDKLGGP